MIIDSHVHLFGPHYFPPRWHEITVKKWTKATEPPRDPAGVMERIEPGLVDPEGEILLQEFDRAGIDAGVCLTLDWGYALGDTSGASPEEMMEHYGHLQKKLAGRFYAIAGIDPRREGALQVYERAIKEWGLKGLKIYPPTGFFPYDDVCLPFYEKSLELGVPVYIHTALMPGYPHRARFANPIGIGEVQYRYPELTIIFAHSGYPIWGEEAIETAQSHPNSYLEISNWNYLAGEEPEKVVKFLAKARDHLGAHRILFGSDHLGGKRFSGERSVLPAWLGFIKSLPERAAEYGHKFTQEEVDLILGGNAQRVLRIPG